MRVKTLMMIGAVALFSISALADDGHKNNNGNNGNNGNSSFDSSVIGSMPALVIGGVNSGGVPWVVGAGEASISPNGRVHVEVHGLLIAAPATAAGTTGPVTMVGATLVCGGTGGSPVAVADLSVTPSPLSSMGNAQIDQVLTLPPMCFGPVVLVRVFNSSAALGSQLGVFIAATGLTPNAAQNQNQNDHGDGGRGY